MILSQPSMLSQHRLRHGWSQARLASESNVSRTEISAIETGRLVPSVAVALRLAAAMGESVEVLFGAAPASVPVPWAWSPLATGDTRVWRATVSGRLLAYPVESTSAGIIPHDGTIASHGFDVVSPDARPDRTLMVAGCDPIAGLRDAAGLRGGQGARGAAGGMKRGSPRRRRGRRDRHEEE